MKKLLLCAVLLTSTLLICEPSEAKLDTGPINGCTSMGQPYNELTGYSEWEGLSISTYTSYSQCFPSGQVVIIGTFQEYSWL